MPGATQGPQSLAWRSWRTNGVFLGSSGTLGVFTRPRARIDPPQVPGYKFLLLFGRVSYDYNLIFMNITHHPNNKREEIPGTRGSHLSDIFSLMRETTYPPTVGNPNMKLDRRFPTHTTRLISNKIHLFSNESMVVCSRWCARANRGRDRPWCTRCPGLKAQGGGNQR